MLNILSLISSNTRARLEWRMHFMAFHLSPRSSFQRQHLSSLQLYLDLMKKENKERRKMLWHENIMRRRRKKGELRWEWINFNNAWSGHVLNTHESRLSSLGMKFDDDFFFSLCYPLTCDPKLSCFSFLSSFNFHSVVVILIEMTTKKLAEKWEGYDEGFSRACKKKVEIHEIFWMANKKNMAFLLFLFSNMYKFCVSRERRHPKILSQNDVVRPMKNVFWMRS